MDKQLEDLINALKIRTEQSPYTVLPEARLKHLIHKIEEDNLKVMKEYCNYDNLFYNEPISMIMEEL